MTKTEEKTIRDLELSAKLVRKALTQPAQYSEPHLAQSNIEYCVSQLEKANAQVRYLTELVDRLQACPKINYEADDPPKNSENYKRAMA
jgi:hypothetical protein